MQEGLEVVGAAAMADLQVAEVHQPGKAALDPPAMPAELAVVVVGGVLAESAWMHRKGRKGSPAPA
jgi:hypothetical protein